MDTFFDVTINIDKLFRVLTQAQKDELRDRLEKERQNLTTQETLREKLLDAARDSRPDDNVTLSLSYVAIDQVQLFKYTNTSFSGGEWHRRLVDRQIVVTVPVYSPWSVVVMWWAKTPRPLIRPKSLCAAAAMLTAFVFAVMALCR